LKKNALATRKSTMIRSLMFFFSFALFISAAEPFEVKTLEIGSPAPNFSLKGIDDKMHALKDFADAKVLAIVFTCNHCPEAYAASDRIQENANFYKDKSVAVIAISGNDPLALERSTGATDGRSAAGRPSATGGLRR
jgi:peroxiredoxin